jgi:hypothetical protein
MSKLRKHEWRLDTTDPNLGDSTLMDSEPTGGLTTSAAMGWMVDCSVHAVHGGGGISAHVVCGSLVETRKTLRRISPVIASALAGLNLASDIRRRRLANSIQPTSRFTGDSPVEDTAYRDLVVWGSGLPRPATGSRVRCGDDRLWVRACNSQYLKGPWTKLGLTRRWLPIGEALRGPVIVAKTLEEEPAGRTPGGCLSFSAHPSTSRSPLLRSGRSGASCTPRTRRRLAAR